MPSLVYRKDPKSGVVYVYKSFSYWDKELKQGRSHRKLIGKLDPDTQQIVPTGKRGPHGKRKEADTAAQAVTLQKSTREQELEETVTMLRKKNDQLEYQLKVLRTNLGGALQQLQRCLNESN